MNELSVLIDFIIARFNQQKLVNTITIIPTINLDANKENIYPLVNIDLTDTDIQNDAIIGTYRVTVVNQREILPKVTNSKLVNDTNYLDNLNETHSIAARFINKITRLHNDENVMIGDISKLTPLKNWHGGLDGFQFDVDLSIFNKDIAE